MLHLMPLVTTHPRRCTSITVLALLAAIQVLSAASLPQHGIVAVNPVGDGDSLNSGGAAVFIGDGMLLTLDEVISGLDDDEQKITVVLPDGRRQPSRIVKRGSSTGAVLLRLEGDATALKALRFADSRQLQIGDTVWTLGSPFDALALDGSAALSQGVVSGLYDIPADAPPVRGRGGAVLSNYRGAVIETDAALNDGNQGGALLDANGHLVGICSLGVARERKLGTAVPIHLIAKDLQLPQTLEQSAKQTDPILKALQEQAARSARSVALVYMIRKAGPGNPQGMPRPPTITDRTPSYQRKNIKKQWDRYYHQQQTFYTDQAVPCIIIDADEGLLLTAASNLHGDAESGYLVASGSSSAERNHCKVLAKHTDLDLALLECDKPLHLPDTDLAEDPDLHSGDPVAVIGRHRDGGPYTMTTGVVSAIDRRVGQAPHPLHQTGALANYGSLGGAVINVHGQTVGMIVRLHPTYNWGINSGVALFVDSQTIHKVLPDLRAGTTQGKQIIGLGVSCRPAEQGVAIQAVAKDSGAAAAGIKVGDRIIAIAGQEIKEPTDINRLLIRRQAGDVVAITIKRGEETLTLNIELKLLS